MRRSSILVAGMLTAGAALAQGAQPAMFITGPYGEQATLTFSADGGWRWQGDARSKPDRAPDKPLTVFVDGPTGNTFVYWQREGWKFVGRIADTRRSPAED